jgi:muramoyltetrapeptide carboxypeptidase
MSHIPAGSPGKAQARIKPRPLAMGDTLGLVAPSGSTKDAKAVAKGVAALEKLGFKVLVGRSCLADRYGYLAADDNLRASDINEFFADPQVQGIVCFKGGYGTPRMLDLIDYAVVAANPKVFVGYSDITAIHLAFARYAGFPTFHGLMASSLAGKMDNFSQESWLRCLTSAQALGEFSYPQPKPAKPLADALPDTSPEAPETGGPKALVPGRATGLLMGGNLSLVAALTGTPYALEPEGKIVFLEDVNEEPYRVDRMLTQLRLAGVFERCEGVVLGSWTHCEAEDPERSLTLLQVFNDVIAPAGKPVLMGFPAGHCLPTLSLPLGVKVVVDADEGTLRVTEAATSL